MMFFLLQKTTVPVIYKERAWQYFNGEVEGILLSGLSLMA